MSADNGVYLHKFKEGWRVVHGQAVENINYKPEKDGYNHKELHDYFSESPVFKTEIAAMTYAMKLYKKYMDRYGCVEYGIAIV